MSGRVQFAPGEVLTADKLNDALSDLSFDDLNMEGNLRVGVSDTPNEKPTLEVITNPTAPDVERTTVNINNTKKFEIKENASTFYNKVNINNLGIDTSMLSAAIELLTADGKLNSALLPKISITEVYVVATQAAMLALNAEPGDIAVREDQDNLAYMLTATPASVLANWLPLSGSAVASVNGRSGTVVVSKIYQNRGSSTIIADTTYSGFSYRITIPLDATITSNMFAECVLSVADATSGNYAPICETYNGGVYLYAKQNGSISVPTILINIPNGVA